MVSANSEPIATFCIHNWMMHFPDFLLFSVSNGTLMMLIHGPWLADLTTRPNSKQEGSIMRISSWQTLLLWEWNMNKKWPTSADFWWLICSLTKRRSNINTKPYMMVSYCCVVAKWLIIRVSNYTPAFHTPLTTDHPVMHLPLIPSPIPTSGPGGVCQRCPDKQRINPHPSGTFLCQTPDYVPPGSQTAANAPNPWGGGEQIYAMEIMLTISSQHHHEMALNDECHLRPVALVALQSYRLSRCVVYFLWRTGLAWDKTCW